MSKQDLERLDDQGTAAWDNHKPQAWVDLFADQFVLKDTTEPELIRTKEGALKYAELWLAGFPDFHLTITNRVVGEDSVAGEFEFTGTHTGPLAFGDTEIPPTGKSVVGRGAYFSKVEDGKVVEFSMHPDSAGLMVQLGLMPQG